MLLLSNAIEMEDSCWEKRLKCGKVFNPHLTDSIHLFGLCKSKFEGFRSKVKIPEVKFKQVH